LIGCDLTALSAQLRAYQKSHFDKIVTSVGETLRFKECNNERKLRVGKQDQKRATQHNKHKQLKLP